MNFWKKIINLRLSPISNAVSKAFENLVPGNYLTKEKLIIKKGVEFRLCNTSKFKISSINNEWIRKFSF